MARQNGGFDFGGRSGPGGAPPGGFGPRNKRIGTFRSTAQVEKDRWRDNVRDDDFWWRLLIGAMGPLGTSVWGKVLGKDLDPYGDFAGGPTDKQLEKARDEEGIDVRGARDGRRLGRAIAIIAAANAAAGQGGAAPGASSGNANAGEVLSGMFPETAGTGGGIGGGVGGGLGGAVGSGTSATPTVNSGMNTSSLGGQQGSTFNPFESQQIDAGGGEGFFNNDMLKQLAGTMQGTGNNLQQSTPQNQNDFYRSPGGTLGVGQQQQFDPRGNAAAVAQANAQAQMQALSAALASIQQQQQNQRFLG